MSTKKILTTTGFLMPTHPHFEVFEVESFQLEDFIARDNNYLSKSLIKYWGDNHISHSPAADQLHRTYVKDPSYENFIALVDFMAEILGSVDMRVFLDWQAYNRHLSGISLMMCQDLINHTLSTNMRYHSVPLSSRFLLDSTITKDQGAQRLKAMLQNAPEHALSWVHCLEPILEHKASLVFLFRYLFVTNP